VSKGQYTFTSKAIYFIFSILIVAAMFILFFNNAQEYQKGSVECLDNVYHELMIAKTLTSPSCFVYSDKELNRAIPGTIDLEKFTSTNLESCFKYLDLDSVDFLATGSVLSTKMQISVHNVTIGSNITSPYPLSKTVYLYENDKLVSTTPEVITYTFEESKC